MICGGTDLCLVYRTIFKSSSQRVQLLAHIIRGIHACDPDISYIYFNSISPRLRGTIVCCGRRMLHHSKKLYLVMNVFFHYFRRASRLFFFVTSCSLGASVQNGHISIHIPVSTPRWRLDRPFDMSRFRIHVRFTEVAFAATR